MDIKLTDVPAPPAGSIAESMTAEQRGLLAAALTDAITFREAAGGGDDCLRCSWTAGPGLEVPDLSEQCPEHAAQYATADAYNGLARDLGLAGEQ